MKNSSQNILSFIAGTVITGLAFYLFLVPKVQTQKHLTPFQINIVKATADNTDFRHVLFTSAKSQLVVMSIPPGGEVGEETHPYVEQTLYFQSGTGQAILDGKTSPIVPGDVFIVTPGIKHNFLNTGTEDLKIFTTYAPPNHIDGRIQKTIQEANADKADEAFGQAVR